MERRAWVAVMAMTAIVVGVAPALASEREPEPWPQVCRVVMPEDLDR